MVPGPGCCAGLVRCGTRPLAAAGASGAAPGFGRSTPGFTGPAPGKQCRPGTVDY